MWFTQVYRSGGLHTLLTSQAGYLQTSSRLVAWLATAFPAGRAPLVYNLFGIGFQALPAVLLATQRFDHLIPNWRLRALLAGLYLGLPNSAEINVTLTNAQWHLALILPLLAFATPPRAWPGRVADGALFAIAALSGPFCLFVAPFLAYYWFKRGRPVWLSVLLGMDLLAGALQMAALVVSHSGARRIGVSTDLPLLFRVVASQVFVGLSLGQHGYVWLRSLAPMEQVLLLTLAFVAGTAVVGVALARGPLELRLFLGYGAALLVSSLVVTGDPTIHSYWIHLLIPGSGQRYFAGPMLAVAAALVWLVGLRQGALRAAGLLLLLTVIGIGVRVDWRHAPYRDLQFQSRVAACQSLSSGTTCKIPINPPGWQAELVRR